VLALFVIGIVAVNAVAYFQARAMLVFQSGSDRTPPPEKLSVAGKLRALLFGVTIPRPANHDDPGKHGLPYRTETVASTSGNQLEAWRIPGESNRPVVLLFHGYSAAKDNMLPVAKTLHSLGCETWLVDFRGSGGSTGNRTSIGYHESDDVAAVFRHVQANLGAGRKLVLLGSSMGAVAILRAMETDRLQPDALVLECPFDRLLTTVENRFRMMSLPPFPLARLLVFWGGWQSGFNGFKHNPVDYARTVRCPALLLHGVLDTRVRLPEAQAVAATLGANVTFKIFERLGHECYAVGESKEWRHAVATFLDGLAIQGRAP
jgi:alpha-beta hydrolase superfamily lysophospholipase